MTAPHEPDWQTLVLAHLTGTEHPTEDDLTNPHTWRHAYATLMSMRGHADPPELLATLAQRMDDLEHSVEGTDRLNRTVFEAQNRNMNDLTERVNFLEMQVRYGHTPTTGEGT